MFWEGVVVDALDPQRLGRFWEAALGGQTLTDTPGDFETRLVLDGGPSLDVCLEQVTDPPSRPPRLHLDLHAGDQQAALVDRLLGLGATHLDVGPSRRSRRRGLRRAARSARLETSLLSTHQGEVPRAVLADPEGNPFCVREEQEAYADTGPIAAIPVASADPDRDAAFWAWLTGWTDVAPRILRHPSLRGPLLELCPEDAPSTGARNRLHLDIRLERGDDGDAVARGIEDRGGRELHPGWGELPWRIFADPSGNWFCLLPTRG